LMKVQKCFVSVSDASGSETFYGLPHPILVTLFIYRMERPRLVVLAGHEAINTKGNMINATFRW
jgi:hypothetical protein